MAGGQSDCFMLLNYFMMMLLMVTCGFEAKLLGFEQHLKSCKSFFIFVLSYRYRKGTLKLFREFN